MIPEARGRESFSSTVRTRPQSRKAISYEQLSLASVGSVERLEGKIVGMNPPHFATV